MDSSMSGFRLHLRSMCSAMREIKVAEFIADNNWNI